MKYTIYGVLGGVQLDLASDRCSSNDSFKTKDGYAFRCCEPVRFVFASATQMSELCEHSCDISQPLRQLGVSTLFQILTAPHPK